MQTKSINTIINSIPEKVGNASGVIGKGLMAGFIGTGIMTLSQLIEMKLTKREGSNVPVKALEEVAGVEISKEDNTRLNYAIHFLYGIGWGKARAVLASLGLNKWLSSLLHFGLVWSTEILVLPKMKLIPPLKEWGSKAIIKDILFHLIYVATTGLVYDEMNEKAKC